MHSIPVAWIFSCPPRSGRALLLALVHVCIFALTFDILAFAASSTIFLAPDRKTISFLHGVSVVSLHYLALTQLLDNDEHLLAIWAQLEGALGWFA